MYSRDTSSGWLVTSEMERKQKALRLKQAGASVEIMIFKKEKK